MQPKLMFCFCFTLSFILIFFSSYFHLPTCLLSLRCSYLTSCVDTLILTSLYFTIQFIPLLPPTNSVYCRLYFSTNVRLIFALATVKILRAFPLCFCCAYFSCHFHTNFMLIRPGARGGQKEQQAQGLQWAEVVSETVAEIATENKNTRYIQTNKSSNELRKSKSFQLAAKATIST